MTKLKFLLSLQERLTGLPRHEVEERLNFYSEMIDDRMEEGLSEEDAVAAIGSVDQIAAQIVADVPLTKIAVEKIRPKREIKAWEIVLLVLGSPVWLSLLVAAAAVGLSLYVSLWAVVGSLWSVFASLAACSLAGIVSGISVSVLHHAYAGVALIAAGLILAGLSVFVFFGCNAATQGIAVLTKKFALWVKKCIVNKEGAA